MGPDILEKRDSLLESISIWSNCATWSGTPETAKVLSRLIEKLVREGLTHEETKNSNKTLDDVFLQDLREAFGERSDELSSEAVQLLRGLWDAGRRAER